LRRGAGGGAWLTALGEGVSRAKPCANRKCHRQCIAVRLEGGGDLSGVVSVAGFDFNVELHAAHHDEADYREAMRLDPRLAH